MQFDFTTDNDAVSFLTDCGKAKKEELCVLNVCPVRPYVLLEVLGGWPDFDERYIISFVFIEGIWLLYYNYIKFAMDFFKEIHTRSTEMKKLPFLLTITPMKIDFIIFVSK